MQKWRQTDVSSNFFHPEFNLLPTVSVNDVETGKHTLDETLIMHQSFDHTDLSLQYIDIQSELEPLRASPVILESVYGSGSNSEAEDETDTHIHYDDDHSHTYQHDMQRDHPFGNFFRKLKFRDVEKSVAQYYEVSQDTPYSNELDILITFIKGQTQLYLEAKSITQYQLHCLMFPTLLISALLTITSPYLSCNRWNLEITSGMNAIVTFLLSMIHYLKLESTMESYSQMANHLDTVYSSLEMTSSKITFLKDQKQINTLIIDKFNEIEEKIKEQRLHHSILLGA